MSAWVSTKGRRTGGGCRPSRQMFLGVTDYWFPLLTSHNFSCAEGCSTSLVSSVQ